MINNVKKQTSSINNQPHYEVKSYCRDSNSVHARRDEEFARVKEYSKLQSTILRRQEIEENQAPVKIYMQKKHMPVIFKP